MSLAGIRSATGSIAALSLPREAAAAPQPSGTRLERVHALLTGRTPERLLPLLADAHARAERVAAAGGMNEASDAMAAQVYAADVLANLAAEGELEPADTQAAVAAVAEACSLPPKLVSFDLYLRIVSSPVLFALPPVFAAGIELRLLLHLDIASEISLWRKTVAGEVECVIALECEPGDRLVRRQAKTAMSGRSPISLVGRSGLRTATVSRFGTPTAVIVARLHRNHDVCEAGYLAEAAVALSSVLEREHLLERNAASEQALVATAENRLTRLGFDLHDGPIQEVLALGAETRQLGDQAYPFVLDSHREAVRGRFDDLLARLVELDRQLRETAHSLESRSIVSRPLAEVLHREVEAFERRTGIAASAEVVGDPEALSSSHRVAIFRAVQEALSNVREHSGATSVNVRLKVRRNSVNVRITDNGHGFEVNRSLALAAERGRLGLVGIGERMRILGGSFDIDSRPGGPTVLRFSLPRWEPFEVVSGNRGS